MLLPLLARSPVIADDLVKRDEADIDILQGDAGKVLIKDVQKLDEAVERKVPVVGVDRDLFGVGKQQTDRLELQCLPNFLPNRRLAARSIDAPLAPNFLIDDSLLARLTRRWRAKLPSQSTARCSLD